MKNPEATIMKYTCLAFGFLLAQGAVQVQAQTTAAGRALTEVVETMLQQSAKQAGKQAAEQLAEIGGKQAVREVAEKAASEGGAALVEKLAANTSRYGLVVLQGAKESPAAFMRALEGVPESLRGAALAELRREPAVLTGLVREAGADALIVAGKNPGTGAQIMRELGGSSAGAVKELTQDQAIQLARHSGAIAKVADAGQRSQFLQLLAKAPQRVLGLLEKNPKVLYTSAALAAFLASKDQFLGTDEVELGPDGQVIKKVTKSGFIERMFDKGTQTFGKPIMTVAWVGSALISLALAGWLFIKLRASHKITAVKMDRAVAEARRTAPFD